MKDVSKTFPVPTASFKGSISPFRRTADETIPFDRFPGRIEGYLHV